MWSMKMGEINMNQGGGRCWKIKSWWKRRGGSKRGLEGGWMVRGGRVEMERERQVLSMEKRESRNEQYIASGKQKTIVTLPPITHFNLKQQIFFTQLISTHWSRGLGWSWAFMWARRIYTHLSASLAPYVSLQLEFLCFILLFFVFVFFSCTGSLTV